MPSLQSLAVSRTAFNGLADSLGAMLAKPGVAESPDGPAIAALEKAMRRAGELVTAEISPAMLAQGYRELASKVSTDPAASLRRRLLGAAAQAVPGSVTWDKHSRSAFVAALASIAGMIEDPTFDPPRSMFLQDIGDLLLS